jgi:hypothetical protein
MTLGLRPAFSALVAYECRRSVEGDSREPGGCCQAVEPLSDRVGVRWTADPEGEHVVAWVIGGTEQFPFAVVPLAPSAQRGKGGPVNRYRFVGLASFATGLVPRVATDNHPIVVNGDLAGIEVDPYSGALASVAESEYLSLTRSSFLGQSLTAPVVPAATPSPTASAGTMSKPRWPPRQARRCGDAGAVQGC